jgi:NAD(P)-dependent dehydrogenase (short-subunit alcohol dehydrogenase family)
MSRIRSSVFNKEFAMNWLITGVSSGFGRALSELILEKGGKVAGTVRKDADKVAFEKLAPGRAFGILLDVTDEAAVHRAVKEAEEKLDGIEVLVNNAGYGFEGALEEATLDDFRQQFDVNVFGAIAMMQATLPYLRSRRAGHILNISSMGGLMAFAGISAYHGSKFALEGISESLAKEVKHLGIKVTIVEPGGFRTDWAGRSMRHVERQIEDYEASAGWQRKRLAARNGNQPGDPRKAAEAMLLVTQSEEPPLHLLLGSDALQMVGEKLGALQAELMKWAKVSASTDYPTQ